MEKASILQGVDVANGVTAQWYAGDNTEDGNWNGSSEMGTKEGKIEWRCALEAKAKVDLTLQWEVSAAKEVVVAGL